MATAEITCSAPVAVKQPRLRTVFAWTLAGNVVYAGCQWGMISVLAKLGTTVAVGQFALALAITAPVFMLSNLFLRGIQATDARDEFSFGEYFTLRAVGTAVGLAVIAIILLAYRRDSLSLGVVLFVSAAKSVESFTDVIAGLLQKHERLDQVAISMILKGLCSVAGFSAAFLWSHSVVYASAAMAVTWLAVFVAYDLRVARRLLHAGERYFVWNRSQLIELTKLAAPVGIVMGLVSLNANIPRYAVAHYRGSGELGIFAALAYLVVVVNLIVNALGQSAIARLSRSFAEGSLRHFRTVLERMSLIGVGVAGGGIVVALVIGRPTLRLIYGPVYATHLNLLLMLIAISGVTAVASFLGYGMSAARRFRQQLPVTLISVATCAVAAYTLTPLWGLMGAAVAILLSVLAQIAGSFFVLRRAFRDAAGSAVELEMFVAGSTGQPLTATSGSIQE
ncbi:MAG TPA: oligosaccharide flippase family protein [Verrucomicrobiae bacterium]|nr:oligosaccharide flippase family protein [Verrucomicrobiae bacterium]